MQTLLRKWWVILIQGILLIVLSIYVFNHPGVTLLSIAFWISLLILGAGLTGIIGSLLTKEQDRETPSLLWSIGSTLLGLLLLAKIGFAMELITNLLGIWMVVTGAWLMHQGWSYRKSSSLGWVAFVIGLFSAIAGVSVIFNIAAGAVAVSTIVGIQLLVAGIGLIILSMLKKTIAGKVKTAASGMRSKFQ